MEVWRPQRDLNPCSAAFNPIAGNAGAAAARLANLERCRLADYPHASRPLYLGSTAPSIEVGDHFCWGGDFGLTAQCIVAAAWGNRRTSIIIRNHFSARLTFLCTMNMAYPRHRDAAPCTLTSCAESS